MDCLEFANISFHSSASIGHLCEDLCTILELRIRYDTFKILNRKYLLFLIDIISALSNDNVLCGFSGCTRVMWLESYNRNLY